MKRLVAVLSLTFLIMAVACNENESEIVEKIDSVYSFSPNRIAWDGGSLQKLAPLPGNTYSYTSYPRMIELANGDFICVYEANGNIDMIRSSDKADTWTQPERISTQHDNTIMAVPEIIQLTNGDIIVSYNPRPGQPSDDSRRFGIATKISIDNGTSWGDENIVYEADYVFSNGCWEPFIIQLNNGETQLYFANEGDYTVSNEQNISMFRSHDQGRTWGEREVVSFSPTSRDGMPVAVELDDGDVIMSIEDNFAYNFKPAIIRTSNDWANATVGRSTPDRAYALDHDLQSNSYQGAPYIRKLPSGNIVISYQGTDMERNHDISNARMLVEIGDKTGKNFSNSTRPFVVPTGKSALWNSLSVMDERVWALASTLAYSEMQEVWTIAGYEITEHTVSTGAISTENNPPFFVGHQGNSNVGVYLSQDDSGLNLKAEIHDASVKDDNGVVFYLDPTNISSTEPVSTIYSIEVDFDGSYVVNEGFNGSWKESNITLQDMLITQVSDGYTIEFSLDWDMFGGKPSTGIRIGFSLSLIESSYVEHMANSSGDKPYTWGSIKL